VSVAHLNVESRNCASSGVAGPSMHSMRNAHISIGSVHMAISSTRCFPGQTLRGAVSVGLRGEGETDRRPYPKVIAGSGWLALAGDRKRSGL
jgi:hypothetical protein